MAFTSQELEILKQAKVQGKTPEQGLALLASTRGNIKTTQETTTQPFSNKVTDFLGLGGATNVFGRMANSLISRYPDSPLSKIVGQTDAEKDVELQSGKTRSEVLSAGVQEPTGKEMLGASAQLGSVALGTAIGGPVTTLGKMAVGAGLGYAYDVGQDLVEGKSAGDVVTPGLGTLTGVLAPPVLKGAGALIGGGKKAFTSGVNTIAEALPEKIPGETAVQGVTQKTKKLLERVPRFVGRISEDLQESAIEKQRIKTSSPAVAQALKVELPESFIQTVPNANPATKQAFKEVLDIADTPKTTLGQKANPSIVGGNYAVKQYEAIDKQLKLVGKMIGEQIEKLGKSNIKVNMGPAFNQVDSVLAENGIKVGTDGTLSSLKYTDKEMSIIQDLYNKSRKGGEELTAMEVRDIDHLFSKLQREARTDGIADLRVKANGEDMSLFRVFRDIYTNQLENIAPEIRPLNAKYRNLVTLTDDIEDSIFKTPNFNVTKNADQAEFAKVNLRRIFGESQSSPAYEMIADEMDAISRQLGYNGPTPKEVASFVQEVRKLYPEIIPTAGQQGIFTSALDLATQALSAGKVNTKDQQKALRALVESTEQSSK